MFVEIKADLNGQLKVVWANGLGFMPPAYSISADELKEAALAVRAELENLSNWAINRAPETRNSCLANLVKAGKSLHLRLFNDPEKRAEIRELKQNIADEFRSDRQLNIQAEPSLNVPWGLVYDDAAPSPEDLALRDEKLEKQADAKVRAVINEMFEFGNFWSLRYSLSVSSQVRPRARTARSRKNFGLLSLVNAEVDKDIESELGNTRYRDLFAPPPVGVANTLAECQALIERTDRSDILLHFLGHHGNGELDLGAGGKISYDDFTLLLDELAQHVSENNASAYGLLFLNGCESAVGASEYSFRRQAMRSELSGLIATESMVRQGFAADFGYEFLKALVDDGQSVAAAMSALHHTPALWPESLLYGCYAHPGYRIEKTLLR